MFWLVIILGVLVVFAIVTRCYLYGPDLSQYDAPVGEHFDSHHEPSDEHDAVVASLNLGTGAIRKAPRRQQLKLMREYMDGMSEGLDLSSSFTPVDAGGVPAEWVCAPGADSSRRVLYIHGGAFVMGSPRSHRGITSRFSEVAGAAVLAIDYRLMPEHSRFAGVQDCRTAYEWLLDNGPQGAASAERVYVAGDSAGGNLSLMMSAWTRDHASRKADAVVALSPVTDMTMSSSSIITNMETDAMLGPMFKSLAKVPRPLLLWMGFFQARTSPNNPVISPIFGDLSNLPPTLVHASQAEMLVDDGRRYVNRATAAGSVVKLQTWAHVVHVWHMFYPQLTEARQAWDEIKKFIAEVG